MLDKKDKELLHLLQTDCTTPFHDLASAVNLTPNPCWKRIKRLESEGYISKRVALLNKDRLGLELTAFMMIKTQDHSTDWYCKFVMQLKQMPEILSFFRTAGEYDYFLQVLVADIKSYDNFYKKLIKSVACLTEVTSTFAMEEIKYTTSVPLAGINWISQI